jgi:hypothetical protein
MYDNITSQLKKKGKSTTSRCEKAFYTPLIRAKLYTVYLSIDGLLVGSLIKELFELCSIGNLNFSNPALTLGALVDGLSLILENAVTADDLAGDRREDIGSGLDGLDSSDGLTSRDLKVFLGELDVDNITQGVGGVIGDADLGW